MPVRLFSDAHLYRTGSLKWTGITRSNGEPTIGAWVAEMDFGTAPEVAEAMKRAIDDGLLGYQPTWLEPAAAAAAAEFHKRRFGWAVDESHVRLASAVLPALEATIARLVRPGAPVVVPTPAYMPFLSIPTKLGHPVIEVPSLRGTRAGGRGWALDLEGIRAGLEAGAGLVILCNPWNPVGRVLGEEELRALHEVVGAYDALVFADEIHSSLVLDEALPFVSYASLGPAFAAHTVTATAASKGWNIAGLPSAQVILPNDALRARWDEFAAEVRHDASVIGTVGAIAAYERGDEWQREVKELIRGNVERVANALADTPIDFVRPEGTYLTWWGFDGIDLGPLSPAATLRERAGIAANDGRTLGLDVGARGGGIGKHFVFRRRDAVLLHEVFGKRLRSLNLRRELRGAECLDSLRRQCVDEAARKRRLRADDDEIDAVLLGKSDDCRIVRQRDLRHAFGDGGDSRIARNRIEFFRLRTILELPRERMLAPAAADDQNLHLVAPYLSMPIFLFFRTTCSSLRISAMGVFAIVAIPLFSSFAKA